MSQKDFLARLVAKLENAGIPYMISGSLGSSLHGEPRATNDIDLIIDPTESQLNALIQSLSEGYHVSLEAAQEAFRNRSIFNLRGEPKYGLSILSYTLSLSASRKSRISL